ncbi:hypothetical protein BpHYR1_011952 [Brachionus plicatilis]|uniref:Uncharacterized protein n=1 Tax=Brachionus plicatilis TaxID=10195 RepID=A0A3M7Q7W7_BRAPC|nr:hypothetical protein BpHYR1_011952 [Brachionus plicatilis]
MKICITACHTHQDIFLDFRQPISTRIFVVFTPFFHTHCQCFLSVYVNYINYTFTTDTGFYVTDAKIFTRYSHAQTRFIQKDNWAYSLFDCLAMEEFLNFKFFSHLNGIRLYL